MTNNPRLCSDKYWLRLVTHHFMKRMRSKPNWRKETNKLPVDTDTSDWLPGRVTGLSETIIEEIK